MITMSKELPNVIYWTTPLSGGSFLPLYLKSISAIFQFPLVSSILSGIDCAGLVSDSSLFSTMAGVETTQPAQVDIFKTSTVPAEGYDKKCIFCKIVNNEMGTELLHCVRIL